MVVPCQDQLHLQNKSSSRKQRQDDKKYSCITEAAVQHCSSTSIPAQRQIITMPPLKCGGAEASSPRCDEKAALWAHSSFAGVNKLSVWPLIL